MKTPKSLVATFTLCMTVMVCCAEPVKPAKTSHGLSVVQGVLTLQGKPYKGVGVNYFSLFYRRIKNPGDMSHQKGLASLSAAKIPFVRFMACGFWPVDWDLYLRDKEAYFKLLDGVVKSAEEAKIGLIPSLFWHMSTVPDIVGEPMDQLGAPNSKTCEFIRQYTKEVVLRYRASPAIWAWEFGNEYNLHVDLPNASSHRPKIWPSLKTARKRTKRDDLTSRAMLTAYGIFAKTVRKYDKHRILITGNSVPRPSAFNNTKNKSWKPDSPEQYAQILNRDNPAGFDTISIHAYPQANNKYSANAKTLGEMIETTQKVSLKLNKPLFIGEFGAPMTLGADKERSNFQEILAAIKTNNVPLSAVWVFDLPGQSKDWNITFDNRRSYMLKLIAQTNRQIKHSPLKPR
ncbi:MAG: cellulase family glycosylhydrolase [Phycisphaerales bacterium]|jgi:hypothetical protein|nr:cellulase family glycosylhydrolase [Phycisphaerales bacterium]